MEVAAAFTMTIDYTNWRGDCQHRHVAPYEIVYEANEWHPNAQWLLHAYDLDRHAERTFAIEMIHQWSSTEFSPLSHQPVADTLEEAVALVAERIRKRGPLPHISIEQQLSLLDELTEFALGQWLLLHRGLDGHWTDYVVNAPNRTAPEHPLEHYLLCDSPLVRATQERFQHFQQAVQERLHPGMTIASIPCGWMRDLLTLELPPSVSLVGIDLDYETLPGAMHLAQEFGRCAQTKFMIADAWNMEGLGGRFDLIVSNGLTIYEPDDQKVFALYRSFQHKLVPGGVLITSTIPPPPTTGHAAWRMDLMNPDHLLQDRVLMLDIIGAQWTCYRSVEKTKALLREAGFDWIEVRYDHAHLFPTLIAISE